MTASGPTKLLPGVIRTHGTSSCLDFTLLFMQFDQTVCDMEIKIFNKTVEKSFRERSGTARQFYPINFIEKSERGIIK